MKNKKKILKDTDQENISSVYWNFDISEITTNAAGGITLYRSTAPSVTLSY
jgi:hypothetical protein